ncbi:germination protease [Clostridium sp. CAG:411]|jgi:spore protease|nr:GPR endopeptidase [Lachnospiraceae bacterium]CDE46604.1 germination protease [Clostridium sp. CAG:411]
MKRTDLALEAKEAIKGEQEIEGVALKREEKDGVTVATLEIRTDEGSKTMGKEKGTYITVELEEENEEAVIRELVQQMKQLSGGKNDKCFILGLGNREITPDALGPLTIDKVLVTRHLIREFGSEMKKKYHFSEAQALAPGVMAQTGMEMQEIVKGIVDKTAPDIVFVVDALAARSMHRLGRTIQLTDTGISPGAGVGNNRKELNRRTLGVDVIAIGVPTVVDAETIVEDYMEAGLEKSDLTAQEKKQFMQHIKNEKMKGMFMTGQDVDQKVRRMSRILSDALNQFTGAEILK